METGWSSLPRELLDLIIKRLPIKDQIRFGAVTKLCSSVAAGRRHPPSPKLPWIWMTPPQRSHHPGAGDFFSPSDHEVHHLNMPEESLVGYCCGAHEGWLIMTDDSVNKLLFFNPLVPKARFEIQLPDPIVEYLPYYNPVVVLSSVPTDPECLVLVLHPVVGLWIGKPFTGEEWSAVQLKRGSDIILYQGSMYAVTVEGDLMLIEVGSECIGIEAKTAIPTLMDKRSFRSYMGCWRLVESCKGELLMVFFVDDADLDPPMAVRQVFKANLEKGKWEKVRSMGDDMLLLGPNCSMSMKASDLPGNFQGNCVYSVSDHCIHMLDVKRKKIEKNVEQSIDCLFYPKVFFTPSLR